VLFPARYWAGLADGSVTLAFRRWKRPTVKTGGRLRFAHGVLSIDRVTRLDDVSLISVADAAQAGHESLDQLLAFLASRAEGDVYRVELHYLGPDERIALRSDASVDAATRADLDARLARLDRASPRGPWTRITLELIRDRPAVRAPDLAESLGRDTLSFKTDVRKLKALGLTESLKIGYRLSPRGESYLRGA
jgi:hypothetical protein